MSLLSRYEKLSVLSQRDASAISALPKVFHLHKMPSSPSLVIPLLMPFMLQNNFNSPDGIHGPWTFQVEALCPPSSSHTLPTALATLHHGGYVCHLPEQSGSTLRSGLCHLPPAPTYLGNPDTKQLGTPPLANSSASFRSS